jgi:hypothetical protein
VEHVQNTELSHQQDDLIIGDALVLLIRSLGHVVECIGDHIRLLYDLSNGATLAQEIVASSIFPVTEILAKEDHKLNSTFLLVAFGSQSLSKPTSDQISSDTN